MNISKIEKILEYEFKNKKLLIEAVSHPSIHYTKQKSRHFEKLEFLGDRVLGLSIATIMFKKLSKESEVDFAIRLANLASTESLIEIAYKNGLVANFELAINTKSPIEKHNSAIADIMEAIFAAIFLDSDLETVIKIIDRFLGPQLALSMIKKKDNKTKLQEYSQRVCKCLPEYILVEAVGPAHDPIFNIKAKVLQKEACGTGHSKKEAEQAAAKNLLQELRK